MLSSRMPPVNCALPVVGCEHPPEIAWRFGEADFSFFFQGHISVSNGVSWRRRGRRADLLLRAMSNSSESTFFPLNPLQSPEVVGLLFPTFSPLLSSRCLFNAKFTKSYETRISDGRAHLGADSRSCRLLHVLHLVGAAPRDADGPLHPHFPILPPLPLRHLQGESVDACRLPRLSGLVSIPLSGPLQWGSSSREATRFPGRSMKNKTTMEATAKIRATAKLRRRAPTSISLCKSQFPTPNFEKLRISRWCTW